MQEKIRVSREPMPFRAKLLCAFFVLGLILASFYAGWRFGSVAQSSSPPAPTPAPEKSAAFVALKATDPPKREYPPDYNFALYSNGATISGGTNAVLLIDGNSENFDQYLGYGYSTWNPAPGPFVITLKETATIGLSGCGCGTRTNVFIASGSSSARMVKDWRGRLSLIEPAKTKLAEAGSFFNLSRSLRN